MPNPTVSIGFSPTIPAPDAGFINAGPRGDGGAPLLRESFQVPNAGGTSVKTANYTAVAGDNGTLLSFADSSPISPHTLTLPATPSSLPATPTGRIIWKITVQNTGTAVLTIDRNGKTIDGSTTNPTLAQGSGMEIFTDGTNYFTERGGATPPPVIVSTAGITIDGGGSTPTTGSKGFLQIPFAGTITGWTLIADVSGSASITVKKSTFAAFPTNSSIVASAPPALSSQQNATSTTLTGWTTAVAAGDVLEFVLASATTLTRLVLELQITRS